MMSQNRFATAPVPKPSLEVVVRHCRPWSIGHQTKCLTNQVRNDKLFLSILLRLDVTQYKHASNSLSTTTNYTDNQRPIEQSLPLQLTIKPHAMRGRTEVAVAMVMI